MDSNISMVRFLMFMILALIIFFNIAPHVVDEDKSQKDATGNIVDESGSSVVSDASGTSLYCLIDGETTSDKVCKEISASESCQNKFTSLQECTEWKSALEYETDGSSNYLYTTDDIDKKTIMTSDDMIFCLKNDKECEQMEFGDCHDIHIGTYLSEDNCEEAKENLESSDDSSTS
jgi:hypothetical protein